MLEETADQFVRLQIQVGPETGFALAIRPADFSLGQEFDAAIGGGGFEDVTGQVLQSFLARTDGLDIDHPALFPDGARDSSQEVRGLFLQELGQESAEALAQRRAGQEELFTGAGPGAAIGGQPATRNQVMNVGNASGYGHGNPF
jgi:hypothetical protein